MTQIAHRAERPLGPALLRGARRLCPACGRGPAFAGYLAIRDRCPSCGEELSHHRADDAPAWATMLVVGHLMVPPILVARTALDLPVWAHMIAWPALALALCLWLLPPIKGAVLGWQWACRMHGFDRG